MNKNKIKNELKNLSVDELSIRINNLRGELFNLRLHSATSQIKDYKQYNKIRKDIARGLTYYNQKNI